MHFFFDLDGTLLDNSKCQKLGLSALALAAPELRGAMSDTFLSSWREIDLKHHARYERLEIPLKEYRRERLREAFSVQCGQAPDGELDRLFEHYMEGFRSGWELYPDVLRVLHSVPGPVALITNGTSYLQRAKIEHLGIAKFFNDILISEEVGIQKPDTRIFNVACYRLGVSPSSTKYIGDGFENDVKGSAAAGLNPVWLNRTHAPRPITSLNPEEIHTLDDLVIPNPRAFLPSVE